MNTYLRTPNHSAIPTDHFLCRKRVPALQLDLAVHVQANSRSKHSISGDRMPKILPRPRWERFQLLGAKDMPSGWRCAPEMFDLQLCTHGMDNIVLELPSPLSVNSA